MKFQVNPVSKKIRRLGLTVAVATLASVSQAQVTPVTLADGDSVAMVDVNSSAGMYQWIAGGLNQLSQQWFWYRIGAGGVVQPINAISAATWNQTAGPDSLFTSYANAQLDVSINYKLTSLTSGKADILESISVKNNTGSPLDLHFFQYSDFDLANNPIDTSLEIQPDPDFPGYFRAIQRKGSTELSETITQPAASRAEANFQEPLLVNFFTAGYNLNNNLGPIGPGDVAWAFQWDLTVGPNATVDIFKDKLLEVTPVPEPAALGFVSLGLAALLLRRRAP